MKLNILNIDFDFEISKSEKVKLEEIKIVEGVQVKSKMGVVGELL